MAFGSILGSIKNLVDGKVNFPFGIGAKNENRYPPSLPGGKDILGFTNETGPGTEWKDSLGYSFHVVQSIEGNISDITGWSEFRLQINPQELSQDEVFAIEVTPTLRGVLVEHHGSTLKDIVISGTTGISPNRREAGTGRDGSPIFATGTSGYKEFHDLRSYFRLYVEQKRTDPDGTLRMVFRNYKDKEYLYVEPIKFSMKRSAKRPLLYDYTITLKGIGVAGPSVTKSDWSDDLFKVANNLDKALDYLDEGVRTINGAFGILNRFQRDLNSILLAPVAAVQGAIQAVRGGINQTLTQAGITRKAIDDLKNIASNIQLNFSDAIGKNTSSYNAAANRSPTLVGNPNRQTTYDEYTIINALNSIQKGLLLVAGLNDEVFETNVFQQNAGVANVYGGSIAIREPTSVSAIDIQTGDDVQTIAAREFGDPDKFRDIVLLNNLKPPYISDTPGPGVLTPGSKILIPKYAGTGSTGIKRNKEYNVTSQLSEAEKGLGVDIRITGDGDFAISNIKDLDLLSGMENMGQACALKLGYELKSLKRHPSIGTNLQIGRKGATSIAIIRDQIISSFTSDNRVESIPFIDLLQEGGAVTINMLIKLKGVDQPIPIPLKLNV